LVTAALFLRPLLAALQGLDPQQQLRWRRLPLAAPLPAVGGRETFVRAQGDGEGLAPVGSRSLKTREQITEKGPRGDRFTAARAGQPAERARGACGGRVADLPPDPQVRRCGRDLDRMKGRSIADR